MNIFKEWDNLEKANFSVNIDSKQIIMAIHKESNSSLLILYRGLMIKSKWVLLFIALFTMGMVFSYNRLEVVMTLGMINVFYIIGYWRIKRSLKKVEKELDLDRNILHTLKVNYQLIKSILESESRNMIIFIPIMIMAALSLPKMFMGTSLIDLLTNIDFLVIAILCTLIVTPIVYILGDKANNIAFGLHLERLTKNIHNLELIEEENSKEHI